ncbi:ion transporter [Secundilactobacillus collinoides]|uniref:ion transporter n=1 Tax=Secundilactobacillus collinoides TaxID=33960 RepID=UPI0006CF60C5|nr:ion transporter [Secundilactobacillus collinoides]
MQSHHQTKLPISDFYELFIALLAVISVILTLMEFTGSVPASHEPYAVINNVILIIFTIDYFTRLILSREKWQFVKHHIFDLLAIVPFNQVFSFFRLSRLFQVGRIFHVVRVLKLARLARFFQLTRLIGLIGKLNHYAKKIFAHEWVDLMVLHFRGDHYHVGCDVCLLRAGQFRHFAVVGGGHRHDRGVR